MATATSRLDILLTAKNQASPAIRQVEDSLHGLQGTTGLVAKGLTGLFAVISVAGIASLVNMGMQLAEASAKSARLAVAFQTLARQAGESGDAMLAAMRRAARGTIDDTSLMAAANRAMLLGVADTGEELARLLEVAAARGRAMGLSTKDAFDDLVTGIGRMSPLILDNLGIVTGGVRVFEDYAKSLGKAADALTDAERKTALVNVVLEQSAELVAETAQAGDDAVTSWERLRASTANLADALGTTLVPAGRAATDVLAGLADAATAGLTGFNQQMAQLDISSLEMMATRLGETQRQLRADLAAGPEAGRDVAAIAADLREVETRLGAVNAAIIQFYQITQSSAAAVEDLDDAIAGTATEIQAVVDASREAQTGFHGMARTLVESFTSAGQLAKKIQEISTIAQSAARRLEASFLGVVGELGSAAALAGFRDANTQLQAQVRLWKEAGLSAEEVKFRTEEYVQEIGAANAELGRTPTVVRDVGNAFDDLKSRVSGILRAALDPGVGVDPEAFLPRQDAINEDARRLADVAVRGFDSPWADYLNNKFPGLFQGAFEGRGDIRTIAAQILRDFQEGLRPELLDREAAKERVKRMLLGEANLAALAGEIAQELSAEFGGQFTPAQIQAATGQALGIGDTGVSAAQAFSQSAVAEVATQNPGVQMVDRLKAQLENSDAVARLRVAGQNAARQWGDAFLALIGDNIPVQLVEILVNLVTPGVEGLLAQRATQKGAL